MRMLKNENYYSESTYKIKFPYKIIPNAYVLKLKKNIHEYEFNKKNDAIKQTFQNLGQWLSGAEVKA